jgi:hypothetical protein
MGRERKRKVKRKAEGRKGQEEREIQKNERGKIKSKRQLST